MILVKTLREEPGSELSGIPHRVTDPSKHIVDVKVIDFKKEFPNHLERKDSLIWVTRESGGYIYFIVNPKLIGQKLISESDYKIVQLVISYIRDMKLESIGI